MKPLLTLLSLVTMVTYCIGQGNFQIAYGGTYLDKCNDVNTVPGGGYILAGETKNSDGDQGIVLTKTNAQGQITWSSTYANGVFEMPNSVLIVPSGGYVVVGERYPGTGPSELAYIFQVNNNGAIQW